MSSSRLRASLSAAALLAATFAATAGQGAAVADPRQFPAPGCFTFSDAANDAHVNNTEDVPYDPDLDILGLSLRTTATSLVGYVKVADLAAGPSSTDGHRFIVNFTFGGHVFSMSASSYKYGTGPVRDALAATGQAGHTTQLGVDTPSATSPTPDKGFKASGLKATFDPAANFVMFDLPIADIVKYGGRAFTGSITNVDARSTVDAYALGIIADTTNPENTQATDPKKAWAIGDNRCFPGSMSTRLTLSVIRYPASRTVTARLATTTGQPLPGKDVTFYVNGAKDGVRRTASDGTVTLKNVKPGSTVKAVFVAVSGYTGSTAQTKV